MGAQIAAHLANAGLEVRLLDLAPAELTVEEVQKGRTLASPEVRNRIVRSLFERMTRLSPAPFFVPRNADRITLGNLEDDWGQLAKSDWIIEAALERLDLKQNLHRRIAATAKADALVTTNTSGLPVNQIMEGLPLAHRRRFFGTHFFNPPRYMRLLELVPDVHTDPGLLAQFSAFTEETLGKGVVIAKDTPGFIANRIGCFDLQSVLWMTLRQGKTIEEVDVLTGPLIGRPGSATFRLCDIIGLDLLGQLCLNLRQALPSQEEQQVFDRPPVLTELLTRGWLGEKSGRGFYTRQADGTARTISVLDLTTFAYRPQQRPDLPVVRETARVTDTGSRLKAICQRDDDDSRFVWQHLSATLCYAADQAAEIADDVAAIDRAMRLGFNWELGPFETWDALGVAETARRLETEGRPVPTLVRRVLETPERSFYRTTANAVTAYATNHARHVEIPGNPKAISLPRLKRAGAVIKELPVATLIDVGDGVACLEFRGKANTIDEQTLDLLGKSLEIVRANFAGLIIGNQGAHFSAGADLRKFLGYIESQDWNALEAMLSTFQTATSTLRRFEKPVVVAIHGYTLGGGCEMAMGCHAVVAAAETIMGFPETKVGLIPGAHGTKEMLRRCTETVQGESAADYLEPVRTAWDMIFSARLSASAVQAMDLRLLRPAESTLVMNREWLIGKAKAKVLALAPSHRPQPAEKLPAIGSTGLNAIRSLLEKQLAAGEISAHDVTLGTRLARVLCGGEQTDFKWVPEKEILELERDTFLGLCREPKTVERIKHMLEKGKPLRN